MSKPLEDLTKEEVAKVVTDLGDRYIDYASLFVEHGIDGGLLNSLDETGALETCEDLGISNRLHRRVLLRGLEKAKEAPMDWGKSLTKTETVVSAFDLAIRKQDVVPYHTTSSSTRDTLASSLSLAHDLSTFTNCKCCGDVTCASSESVSQKAARLYQKPYEGHVIRGCVNLVTLKQVSNCMHCGKSAGHHSRRVASHELPIFKSLMHNEEDRKHLSSNFHDMVNALKIPKPPIAKNDMERCAAVDTLRLTDIRPNDDIAYHLQAMVKMATEVFRFPYGEITFHDNEFQYRMASYCEGKNPFTAINSAYQPIHFKPDGKPFLCKTGRGASLCNYTIAAGRTFVIKDIIADETFAWLNTLIPIRCYVGSPIKDSAGRVIAGLCLFDTKPRSDIEAAHEIQMEQCASLIAQKIESWAIARTVERVELERNLVAQGRIKTGPPKGVVALVITDIQGSTALWEADPVAMQTALDLHDSIIRQLCAEHWGYEVETEGDSFILAFHDPVDAIAFALSAQMALFEAKWSQDILRLPQAREEAGAFRGLRVRMVIHQGDVVTSESGRVSYSGEAMNLTKNLASMTNGGQILTTYETWEVASYFMGKKLGYPQVIDLGAYILQRGKTMRDGLTLTRVIQLVPLQLAYDFFAARKQSDQRRLVPPLTGRLFPLVASCKQVSPSFHDAPHENNEVTVAFINFALVADRHVLTLGNLIGSLLDGCRSFNGYQCGKDMLAFRNPLDAVLFGLCLQRELRRREQQSENGTSIAHLIKFACIHGDFLTMGPHRNTGRADYFGKIVNRAARLSTAIAPGSVCLGVVCGCGDQNDQEGSVAPIQHPSMEARFCGRTLLRGIQNEIDVFEFAHTREDGDLG